MTLINELCDSGTVTCLYQQKETSDRGPKQEHFGFTSNNSLKRDSQTFVMKPHLKGNMNDNVRLKMAQLSLIVQKIAKHLKQEIPFTGDRNRNEQFAFQIDTKNVLEHCTSSLTTLINMLASHLDVLNDDSGNGYQYVVVVWKYFIIDGQLAHLAWVGTSRASISNYIVRAPKQQSFCELMFQWFENKLIPA